MTSLRVACISTGIFLALLPGAAAAQRDSASIAGATIRTLSCTGRQRTRDEHLEGILVSLDSSAVRVQTDDLRRLPIDHTLFVERRTRVSRSALGVFAGIPLGAILGTVLFPLSAAERRRSDGIGGNLSLGTFIGPIVGALVGSALMGARWERVPLPAGAGLACNDAP